MGEWVQADGQTETHTGRRDRASSPSSLFFDSVKTGSLVTVRTKSKGKIGGATPIFLNLGIR
jgi:hypothetical protein